MTKHIIHFAFAIAYLLAISVAGCPRAQLETIDELGCPRPAPSVFTQAGVDANLGSSTFGKVITGSVALKITPAVVDLMGKAARNEEIISWLVCRDQKNGLIQTPEQLQYAKSAARFYSLSPTPEQAMKWQSQNPFPGGSTIRIKGRVLSKAGEPAIGVMVTVRYEGEVIAAGATDVNGAFFFQLPIKYHDTELDISYQLAGFAVTYSKFRVLAPSTDLKSFEIKGRD